MGAGVSARSPRRLAAVTLVAAVLAAAGATAATASSQPAHGGLRPDALVALPPAATSFFCAALLHVPGVVDSTVAIANLASSPRVAEVTVTDQEERITTRVVALAPGAVVRLRPGGMLRGAVEAVSVLADRGGLAVTEGVTGAAGTAVAPCLSSTSTSWWLTGGSTRLGQGFLVELYNPTHARAVVSVALTTPEGLLPQAYSGLVLGPYQVVPLKVHSVAPNQAPVTVHVVATDGAVVAEGIQRGLHGNTSMALLVGTPSGQRELVLPSVSSRWPLRTRLELFGTAPDTTVVATVQVLVAAAHCAPNCPTPSTVSVPPNGAVATFEIPTTSVPIGEPFSLVVRAGAPGVLATEVVTDGAATGQSVPGHDPDLVAGDHVVLLDPFSGGFEQVGVVNTSAAPVTVQLETPSAHGLRTIGPAYVVAAASRLVLGSRQLAGLDDGSVLELVASAPIAAGGIVSGTPGASTLPGEPAG